jgi:hypothetical protein
MERVEGTKFLVRVHLKQAESRQNVTPSIANENDIA